MNAVSADEQSAATPSVTSSLQLVVSPAGRLPQQLESALHPPPPEVLEVELLPEPVPLPPEQYIAS